MVSEIFRVCSSPRGESDVVSRLPVCVLSAAVYFNLRKMTARERGNAYSRRSLFREEGRRGVLFTYGPPWTNRSIDLQLWPSGREGRGDAVLSSKRR